MSCQRGWKISVIIIERNYNRLLRKNSQNHQFMKVTIVDEGNLFKYTRKLKRNVFGTHRFYNMPLILIMHVTTFKSSVCGSVDYTILCRCLYCCGRFEQRNRFGLSWCYCCIEIKRKMGGKVPNTVLG